MHGHFTNARSTGTISASANPKDYKYSIVRGDFNEEEQINLFVPHFEILTMSQKPFRCRMPIQ